MTRTSASRAALLERARFNTIELDANDIDVDLSTDVPRRAVLPGVRDAEIDVTLGGARAPALDEAALALYGAGAPGRYVWGVRGRAVELAMAAALVHKGTVVLGNGLFRTTQLAFRRAGAEVELEPGSPSRPGSSDLDLKWLALRLAEGEVGWVCVEASNNALGGWPQSLDNLKAVRALCDQHRAGLLLDATRLLSNGIAAEPGRDPIALAREMTALVDAFWVSCAKELIAPVGALLAVRSLEAQRRAYGHLFEEGTWLDSVEARVRVLRGLQAIAADPSPLRTRRAQLELVAATLRKEGVRILEPPGAHAVFVPVDAELLQGSPARARALECWLYERAGVRVLIAPYPRMGYTAMIRLAIGVGRYQDAQLVGAARAIAQMLHDPSGAPELVELAAGIDDPVHDMVKHYARRLPLS
jgi:tryptophanase